MATRTNNLKLSKAEVTDAVRSTLTANNNNFDKLDDAITRLRANQISGTASGTAIEVADSANMESVLKVSGNSVQKTRSGKNLLDVTATPPFKYNVTKEVIETGVRITSTIDGNSNDSFYAVYVIMKLTSNDVGKTVRLKCDCVSSSTNNSKFRIGVCAQDGTNRTFWANSTTGGSGEILLAVIPELVEGQEYLCAAFSATHGACNAGDYVDYTDVVLTINNADMSYEPYGLMPSPEFESPIKSVKSKSDNLFDGIFELGSINGSSGSNQTGSNYIRNKNFIAVDSNTYYSFSLIDGTKAQYVYEYDENYNYVLTGNKVVKKSFKTESTTKYIRFRPDTQLTDLNAKVMLNKGTVALPYQPYGYVPAEAKAEGKNKLDLATSELGVTAPTSIGDYTRYTIINPNKLVVESLGTWNRVKCTIKDLKPNVSYTISSLIDNPNGANCGFYASSADTLYTNTAKSFKASITKNTNDNGELYFEFYTNWSDTSVTSTITYDEIQVEEGSTVSNFIASSKKVLVPLGDIELRSTPDGTRDTIARVDGVWNVVNNIGMYKFTGNETPANTATRTNTFRFNISIFGKKANATNKTQFMSNYGGGYPDEFWNKDEEGICELKNPSNTSIVFSLSLDKANDATSAKAWLQSHPVEASYILDTPTYTPITDQGLISALDELEQLVLHKGYNRITVTGVNGVKAYLDLNYYKDINIVLDNINTRLGGV